VAGGRGRSDAGARVADAGVFTRDVGNAKAGETLEFGGVLINEVPTFR
jgi:hypothetical protein